MVMGIMGPCMVMHGHAKVGRHGFYRNMSNGNAWCGVERESMREYDAGLEWRPSCLS